MDRSYEGTVFLSMCFSNALGLAIAAVNRRHLQGELSLA